MQKSVDTLVENLVFGAAFSKMLESLETLMKETSTERVELDDGHFVLAFPEEFLEVTMDIKNTNMYIYLYNYYYNYYIDIASIKNEKESHELDNNKVSYNLFKRIYQVYQDLKNKKCQQKDTSLIYSTN